MAKIGGINVLLPDEVSSFLVSETRAALRATREIPVKAAVTAFSFLLEKAQDGGPTPFYSGAYHAALRVGVDDLPSIPEDLRSISNAQRHRIARGTETLGHRPWTAGDALAELADYEADDDIVLGNDIRYASIVEEIGGMLITERARQVAENALQQAIQEFNRRSIAATRGARRRRR